MLIIAMPLRYLVYKPGEMASAFPTPSRGFTAPTRTVEKAWTDVFEKFPQCYVGAGSI